MVLNAFCGFNRPFRMPSRSGLGFGRPEKLSLQSFRVDALPIEFCSVCPALVDPWIDIVSKRCVQIVIASPFLEVNVKLQFSYAFFQQRTRDYNLNTSLRNYIDPR